MVVVVEGDDAATATAVILLVLRVDLDAVAEVVVVGEVVAIVVAFRLFDAASRLTMQQKISLNNECFF